MLYDPPLLVPPLELGLDPLLPLVPELLVPELLSGCV